MPNIHRFQECFKKKRGTGLVGAAYKECTEKYKKIEKSFGDGVYKDGKPKHDLYNLSENNIINELIDKLLIETIDKNDSWG